MKNITHQTTIGPHPCQFHVLRWKPPSYGDDIGDLSFSVRTLDGRPAPELSRMLTDEDLDRILYREIGL